MPGVTDPAPHPAKGELAMRRMTVRHAAQLLGVHEQVLGRILNGREQPSIRIKRDLASLLGVSAKRLFR
jgi:DNA-binding XRE family transcriptional regulator